MSFRVINNDLYREGSKNSLLSTYQKDIVNKLNNIEKQNPKYLRQSDFDNGTYRITKSGYYVLSEDIKFNPNPSVWDEKTSSLSGDDWMPRSDQMGVYPPLPYGLGFFAAITIETKNVVLDLNQKNISQSNEHYLQQRFFACIELANQPFIPNQGPSNFGLSFQAADTVKIKNGYIGMSSHHGIHGNGMKNVVLEDLVIYNFEIAGIALNGSTTTVLKNVKVMESARNVPVAATYSQSRFIRKFLTDVEKTTNPTITLGGLSVNATSLLNQLKIEMDVVYDEFINKNVDVSNPLYANIEKVADGAVYGIVLAQNGVVVGKFPEERSGVGNEDIVLDNITICNLVTKPHEVVGLSPTTVTLNYGINVQKSVIGDVLRIRDIVDTNGYYTPNVLSQSQLYISNVNPTAGTSNITEPVYKEWAENSNVDIQTIIDREGYYYVGGGDSMAHFMKGNIGLFLSGAKNVRTNNIEIFDITNSGTEADTDVYENGYYDGNTCRGIAVASSEDVLLKCSTKSIVSNTSCAIGVDIIGKSSVILYRGVITDLTSASKFYQSPNRKPFTKEYLMSEESKVVNVI